MRSLQDTPAIGCHVCGEVLDGTASALCDNCHRPYHLRVREDDDGQECGQVWVNEQFLSLEHACDVCLGCRPPFGTGEPPVGATH